MADLDFGLAEFQKLCDEKDLAAYRVVGAAQMAIYFYEAQTFAHTYEPLKRAVEHFNACDRAVKQFHERQLLQTEKENSHGNRSAA